MNITAGFELSGGEFEDAIRQVRRFERTRFYTAIGMIAVIGAASLLLDTRFPSLVAAVAIVVLGVLCYLALRLVHLAQKSGRRLAGRLEVTVTGERLVLTSLDRSESADWSEILHCTKTSEAWVFIRKSDGRAYLIPEYALAPRDAEQLSTFLAGWSKRRFRRVPVTYKGLAAPGV